MRRLDGTPEDDASAPVLSIRQESIKAQLLEMIGEGPAAFFADACLILSQNPRPATASHIAAHLLREVESAVRSVLQPPTMPKGPKGQDGHQVKIRAVLDELGVSADEPTALFWLGLTGEGNPSGLAGRAHRSALDAPRPADAEFAEFVNGVEELLDRLLKRFKARYASVFTRMDTLLAGSPSGERVKDLRNKFPQNVAALSYFFGRASSDWLGPLAEGGYFASPPALVLHPEDGTAEIPFWAESNYLVRVAADVPDQAVDAALTIPATDNMRVNGDIVEIALRVPADQSARLASRVAELTGSRFGVLIPVRVGSLFRHLADAGRVTEAMQVAEALLAEPPMLGASRVGDTWSYAEVLRKDFPALVSAAGLPALVLLANALDQAISAQTPGRLAELRQDMSVSWRPDVGRDPSGTDSDPADALASAVRDAASDVTDAGKAGISEVVAVLEAHNWPVFRRLALHLLDSTTAEATDLIEARLTDKKVIRDFNLDREFLALAAHRCPSLSPGGKQALLALIDSGPEMDEWARQHENATGEPPPAAMARDRVARWQRDRLSAVEAILTPERQAQHRALTAEYGQAPDLAASVPPAIREISFASPVPASQLAALPTAELVNLLQTWEPSHNFLGPGRFSLASELGTAVRQDAARRSAEADAFIRLPSDYVSAIINGLWLAVRDGVILDWNPVLRLCTWADDQATGELALTGGQGNAEWRDVRVNVLRLLQAGFRNGPAVAPGTVRGLAWAIIEGAAADPDPSPAAEAAAYSGGQGPGALSLNHVRPQALAAAIAFALWARNADPDYGLSQFHDLLDRHLDPASEPSQAVRWVYGESFAKLAYLDRDWTAARSAAIFPDSPADRHLWEAAWNAYLTYAPVIPELCTMLADQYQMAVNRLHPEAAGQRPEALAFGLGRHLLTLYWLGELSLDSNRQLLRRYYQNSPVPVRIHLTRFLGRSISGASTLDEPIAGRLRELWESRVQAVRNGADPGELTPFAEWFGAGKLGTAWELQQLITSLSLAGRIESEHAALPRLAALAPEHASTCLAVLEAWIRGNPHSWTLQQHEDNIRAILSEGIASGDEAASETVITIVSLCITAGIDLRDVLPRAAGDPGGSPPSNREEQRKMFHVVRDDGEQASS